MPRSQARGPQAVLADKLQQLCRILLKGPHVGLFLFFALRMFLAFARGLMIQRVSVVLYFLRKPFWIQWGLHNSEMIYKLERDRIRGEFQRPLAAIAHVQQHGEERFVPAVNFFQFLGIDRQRYAHIVRPQSVAKSSLLPKRKRAARMLLIPAHGGDLRSIFPGLSSQWRRPEQERRSPLERSHHLPSGQVPPIP